MLEAATRVHELWCGWDDGRVGIVSASDGVRHNTTTPIVRRRGETYEMDLALRCNITSPEHPLGVFHPHEDLHHIKKENIGLIEVMGLFILPGRLLAELEGLKDYLTGRRALDDAPAAGSPLEKHYGWVRGIAEACGTDLDDAGAEAAPHRALAVKCARVLADAGVYKHTPEGDAGLLRFLRSIGYQTV